MLIPAKQIADGPQTRSRDGSYIPLRPMDGPGGSRIRAAWLVLIGKADAVDWQEELLPDTSGTEHV